MERGTGVLCHISSLPGKYGIGSLGREAYEFADWLKKAGVRNWQILPLNQTGFGDSPYQTVSSVSGNPYFIDLEALAEEGLLSKKELLSLKKPVGAVDYGALYAERYQTLRTAFSRFNFDKAEFQAFVEEGTFEDFSLFMTAKCVYGCGFSDWEKEIKFRKEDALREFRKKHHEEFLFYEFLQFEFFKQWKKLKEYCNGRGIKIIGDLPLYVSYDSADVWAHPGLFCLDENLFPKKVAGVPPDYFSEDGQLWGNPIYDWEEHRLENFSWWKKRLSRALELYDYVRIDHFRGFSRYFEIDYGATTAKEGVWRDGPGDMPFEGLKGRERIIAEDLGTTDEALSALLEKTGFPGMRVMLFGFDGNEQNPHLPANYPENCVAYTGTHDNDTIVGYVKSLSSEEFILFRSRVAAQLKKMQLKVRLGEEPASFMQAFLEMLLKSKANVAVLPIQDLLGEGNSCRMNAPGTREGNWKYRLSRIPSARLARRLKKINKKHRR